MSSRKTSTLDNLLHSEPDAATLAQVSEVPHSVSFMLDPADIRQAETRWITRELLTHSVRGWLVMWALIAFTVIFFALLFTMENALILALIVVPVLPIITAWLLQNQTIERRLKNTHELHEETEIAINRAGVARAFSNVTVLYPWEIVREVIVDERQVYIRVDSLSAERIDRDGLQLHANNDSAKTREILIPRRAFLGSGHLEGFLILISAYRSGTKFESETVWPPKPR